MVELSRYSLSDLPKWWGVRALRWFAIGLIVFSALSFLGTAITGYIDSIALHGISETNSVYLNLSHMMDELAWAALSLGFYAAVLWFLSEIVAKVDQLVWLNATDEDRAEILKKRTKKNAKNK